MTAAEPAHIVVVGAGLAGLSSAVWLAEAGHRVTLVEKRGQLGGRTFSRRIRHIGPQGELVDNGQHLFAGFYSGLRSYISTLGTAEHVLWEPPPFAIRTREHGLLSSQRLTERFGRLGRLAAPFWFAALPLPWRDRPAAWRALAKLGAAVANPSIELDDITIDEFYRRIGAPESLRRLTLDQFAIGIVNEKTENASAYTFLRTVHEGARRGKGLGFADAGWPRVPIDDLFVAPAEKFLADHGAEVISGQALTGLELDGFRVSSLTLADGTRLEPDAVVLALTPWALSKLLDETPLGSVGFFDPARQITAAPISSVYVWLDRHLGNERVAENLRDCMVEWVFHTSGMHGEVTEAGHCYSLAVSASWDVVGLRKEEFVEQAMASLRLHYPAARDAKVLHTHVIHQPRATFSARPGFERLRLPQRTPIDNLVLAGDWTRTDLCSTMEGAVESARRAIAVLDSRLVRS